MTLTILGILALVAGAAWWLGLWWASRKKEMLNWKGLLVDLAGIALSALAVIGSWGYLYVIGDPIPKELVPIVMMFMALMSVMMVYVSLTITATHLVLALSSKPDGSGPGPRVPAEKPEKAGETDGPDVCLRYGALA